MITLDTNIFFYSLDDAQPDKQAVALRILGALARADTIVGLQVIGELQFSLTRKQKRSAYYATQAAHNVLTLYETFSHDREAVLRALSYAQAGRLSYWDALLLSSSNAAGADIMFSEDMQDGATLLGVEIVNPFGGGDGLSARAREILNL